MRAIRLNHGVIFIDIDGVTVRVSKDGECELSPVLFDTLEWEMSSVHPDKWEYVTDGEIRSLDGGVYERARALADETLALLDRKEN